MLAGVDDDLAERLPALERRDDRRHLDEVRARADDVDDGRSDRRRCRRSASRGRERGSVVAWRSLLAASLRAATPRAKGNLAVRPGATTLPVDRRPKFSPAAWPVAVGSSPTRPTGNLPERGAEDGKEHHPTVRQGRLDPWRASMDVQHALQARLDERRRPGDRPRGPAAHGPGRARQGHELHRAAARRRPAAGRHRRAADLGRARPPRGGRPSAVADAVVPALRGRAGRPAARRRAGRRRPLRALRRRADDGRRRHRARDRRPRAAAAARRRRPRRLHRRRGPPGVRPQAGGGAHRAPERRAVGAHRPPRPHPPLPRAAAGRALARPARAAPDRPHARGAPAPPPQRGRCRRETQGIRLAALDALEQVDAMLEQVRRDHGEARLALVDDDLAATCARSPSSSTRWPPSAASGS